MIQSSSERIRGVFYLERRDAGQETGSGLRVRVRTVLKRSVQSGNQDILSRTLCSDARVGLSVSGWLPGGTAIPSNRQTLF